jgi:UDP:flavonoid glycosyltransferase YjiC (YdhE family)
VARALVRRRYTLDRVTDELRRLLGDQVLRTRAAEVGRRVAAEDGASAAADVIERVLREQQR